ncbi:MAG: hypothetical protein QF645_00315, partial [Planctomycetota bacterium]|nr:hypothetical protein [Planctomycetota bacterium]
RTGTFDLGGDEAKDGCTLCVRAGSYCNNVGCGKVEGEEMVPTFDQNSLHLLLPGKRLSPEVAEADVVFFQQNPGKGEQLEFAGKVYAGPGEVVWVERKIVSEQVRVDKSMEVRKEKPTGAESSRFIRVIVPRDSWFLLCENTKGYSLYDSRGRGPIGFWALKGRLRR